MGSNTMKKHYFLEWKKGKKECAFIFLVLFAGSQVMTSYADLYTPGAWMSPYGSGTNPALTSWTLPNEQGAGAYLYMLVDVSNPAMPVLTPDYGTVGIGHSWYETTVDTAIDYNYAISTTPFYAESSSDGEIQMTLNLPFYMAFKLGDRESSNSWDTYGWAELMWDGSELQILDSAAENSGVGIIAGKYEAVPEPATILLFGLGGLGAWLLRRNKARCALE